MGNCWHSEMNQSKSSASSLRNNNASLAKKVSELQIELSSQRAAAHQANIELLKYRMELNRLHVYEQTREKVKGFILSLYESLCSHIEMGMSITNSVKESLSLLDATDSSDGQISQQVPSVLGDTTVDVDLLSRKDFTKRLHLVTDREVCQENTNLSALQSSSYTLAANPLNEVKSPVHDEISKNYYTERPNSQDERVVEISPIAESPSPECSFHKDSILASCQVGEQVLPEVLAKNPTANNELVTRKTVNTISTDLHRDIPVFSPIQSFRRLTSSPHIFVSKSPLANLDIGSHASAAATVTPTTTTPTTPTTTTGNGKRDENNIDSDHESRSNRRPHLIRQVRLNAKPIIDTSSFMEPVVKKKKKKKTVKRRRLIRTDESDDDDDGCGGGGGGENEPGETRRVIETCFRRPGQYVFRVDSKKTNNFGSTHDNPSVGVDRGEMGRIGDGGGTRSKSKLASCITRSKSNTKHHTNSDDNANQVIIESGGMKLPTVGSASVFDLSMNQTANLSVLPPTLNDLRLKQKEQQRGRQQQQQAEEEEEPVRKFGVEVEKVDIDMTRRTTKHGVVKDIEQNIVLNLVGDNENRRNNGIDDIDQRRLSVVLDRIHDENQPPYDDGKSVRKSKNDDCRFRRLYLHDCDLDNENKKNNKLLGSVKSRIESSKDTRIPSIDDNKINVNRPLAEATSNRRTVSSRSRERS
ncbi:unnamed protein product [Heterobilharzia americana]|nr:unnamed protein product [Heterobilharzia americana]